VVLDSLTDACDLVSQEIREQSPPKMGKDGLPVDSERYWNVLADRASKLIRAFRDLPLNVVFLCLLDERVNKDDQGVELSRWVGPQLPMRKMPNVVQAAVNVVGVTYRRRAKVAAKSGTRAMEYGIATSGPDWMQLKPFPPLREYEVTDFASWCKRIHGIDDGSRAPEPMDGEAIDLSVAGDVTQATSKPVESKVDAPMIDDLNAVADRVLEEAAKKQAEAMAADAVSGAAETVPEKSAAAKHAADVIARAKAIRAAKAQQQPKAEV
jgi:hypothetical protein